MKYDTSKLNQEGVKASQKGQNWDQNDQARYDKWSDAKERAGEYKAAVEPYKPGDKVTGRQDLKGEDGSKHPGFNSQGGLGGGKGVKQTQASQSINQQNGIKSNVTGDDNYVYNNQDNSIRNYGGDNRSFVYNSNGEGPDTPATLATLAGFYAPNDSPGATAARLDQHVTMNRDNQKKYADTSWRAQGAIKRAEQNSYIDPQALDKRIADRSKYHMAQSTVKGAEVFGDIYGLESPTWNSSKPAKPVEKPDFDKMYDTYTDF